MEDERRFTAELSDADLKKCGYGTKNACFALFEVQKGMKCLGIIAEQGDEIWQEILDIIGGEIAWRQNIDEADQKSWCPKGYLNHSKP